MFRPSRDLTSWESGAFDSQNIRKNGPSSPWISGPVGRMNALPKTEFPTGLSLN